MDVEEPPLDLVMEEEDPVASVSSDDDDDDDEDLLEDENVGGPGAVRLRDDDEAALDDDDLDDAVAASPRSTGEPSDDDDDDEEDSVSVTSPSSPASSCSSALALDDDEPEELDEDVEASIPLDYRCPFTLQLMRSPVVLETPVRASYERAAHASRAPTPTTLVVVFFVPGDHCSCQSVPTPPRRTPRCSLAISRLVTWLARHPRRDPMTNEEHGERLEYRANDALASEIRAWRVQRGLPELARRQHRHRHVGGGDSDPRGGGSGSERRRRRPGAASRAAAANRALVVERCVLRLRRPSSGATDWATAEAACKALARLCETDDAARVATRLWGGLDVLVALLRHDDAPGAVKAAAATAIAQLARNGDNRYLVARAGGIRPLAKLVASRDEPALQSAGALALWRLAKTYKIWVAVAIGPLVDLLGARDAPVDARHAAAGALWTLSTFPANQKAIVDAGAAPLLVAIVRGMGGAAASSSSARTTHHHARAVVSYADAAVVFELAFRRKLAQVAAWALANLAASVDKTVRVAVAKALGFNCLLGVAPSAAKMQRYVDHLLDVGASSALLSSSSSWSSSSRRAAASVRASSSRRRHLAH
mmetsp:Transcript_4436/g.18004  ORF Transcript_4436/g.18004 Transcript_4436/m.18004 type:complete len:595 (-) Transcript_4436:275-2059(-)